MDFSVFIKEDLNTTVPFCERLRTIFVPSCLCGKKFATKARRHKVVAKQLVNCVLSDWCKEPQIRRVSQRRFKTHGVVICCTQFDSWSA